MELLKRVDDWIIDRACQPLVDKLDQVSSCYQLSAVAMITAGSLGMALDYRQQWWFGAGLWLSVVTPAVWRAWRLDAKPPSVTLPLERIANLGTRTIFFILRLGFGVLLISSPTVNGLLNETAWWLFSLGLYLLACRKRPSRSQRVSPPSNALWA